MRARVDKDGSSFKMSLKATIILAVVVAVIWGIIAATLFAVGRSKLKTVDGAPQTVDTLKQIPDTLNPNGDH